MYFIAAEKDRSSPTPKELEKTGASSKLLRLGGIEVFNIMGLPTSRPARQSREYKNRCRESELCGTRRPAENSTSHESPPSARKFLNAIVLHALYPTPRLLLSIHYPFPVRASWDGLSYLKDSSKTDVPQANGQGYVLLVTTTHGLQERVAAHSRRSCGKTLHFRDRAVRYLYIRLL